jgi:hypothetical protein
MYENVALVFWRYEWSLLALCASKSGPSVHDRPHSAYRGIQSSFSDRARVFLMPPASRQSSRGKQEKR